jgi:hypothetical protein
MRPTGQNKKSDIVSNSKTFLSKWPAKCNLNLLKLRVKPHQKVLEIN